MYGQTDGNGTAMNAYGALAMNQLFTVYAQQDPLVGNGRHRQLRRDWKYVVSGLTAGSGAAGHSPTGCTSSSSTPLAAASRRSCRATPTWTARWMSTI